MPASATRIKNVSPLGDLDFPLLRRIVAAGEEVDIPPEVPDEVLATLLDQPDVWAQVTPPAAPAKVKE